MTKQKNAVPTLDTESELKVIPARELQIKLMASLRGDSSDYVIQVLSNAFQLGAYRITHLKRTPLLDEYLDTPDLILFRTNRTLRIRRRDNKITVTAKEPTSFAAGEFHRNEKNLEIDEQTYDAQLASGFGRFRGFLKDVGQSPLTIKLKVNNERDLYNMEGNKEEYEVAVDVFSYTNTLTGQTSPQQFEVEVEAKNRAAVARLPSIKGNLLALLTSRQTDHFTLATETKYQRGVRLLGISQSGWRQKLSAWATRSTAQLLNLSIGVVGLIVGVVALIVTISLALWAR